MHQQEVGHVEQNPDRFGELPDVCAAIFVWEEQSVRGTDRNSSTDVRELSDCGSVVWVSIYLSIIFSIKYQIGTIKYQTTSIKY